MKASLQTRVSIFITLTIILISAFSTYLFTSAYRRNAEQSLVVRGTALSYSLSKAAEEGLLKEDLNLIKKASHIIEAPDVSRAQVYSDLWDALDAYPLTSLKDLPNPEAVRHFKVSSSPFSVKVAGGYDFYDPIMFKAFENSPLTTIGFVRITLSSSTIKKELASIVVATIAVSVVITLFAILSLNYLIRRYIVRPVTSLHGSISQFKNGILPGDRDIFRHSPDEIRELAQEFYRMCEAVREDENKLIESERRIRSLFERVEHAIFRINEYGAITESNDRFRKLFGNVTELCDILIGEASATQCMKRAASEKTLHIEDKAVAHNGDELTIALSMYAERNEAGSIDGFDGYLIDITEKKRLEERLVRSQKLEAIGTLAAGMAHDFNNLLTAILGYSGIMLKMTKEDDPFYKPVSVINDAAKRGAALGKKILTITRKEKMEAKPVNVNDLINQSIDLLRSSFPRNVDVVMHLDASLPTTADPSQLQQVIINLAVNARDAMPDGGTLTVETAVADPATGVSSLAPAHGPGFIKLSVSDTGMGIGPDAQSRIFDPFFTTKEVGKGTGLGLYIVHSIITNHGGYINVYSEPRKGTRFNIYLPISTDASIEARSEAMDISGNETVLIIDDEPHVRDLCKDMLVPLGYTVLIADSGSHGIKLYREHQAKISLVILDIIMPQMGGNEVFHALKTINKYVPILLYSGYSHNNFSGINDLLKSGAAGFIQKPFSTQDLGIAIRKALSA
ncbi:MAG: ATP-binding protein [Nitrospiraceae bacterium]|nr:ATP-binding protein [Nitrospiraceae bacterium]